MKQSWIELYKYYCNITFISTSAVYVTVFAWLVVYVHSSHSTRALNLIVLYNLDLYIIHKAYSIYSLHTHAYFRSKPCRVWTTTLTVRSIPDCSLLYSVAFGDRARSCWNRVPQCQEGGGSAIPHSRCSVECATKYIIPE